MSVLVLVEHDGSAIKDANAAKISSPTMIDTIVSTRSPRSRERWPRTAPAHVTMMITAMARDSAPSPVDVPHQRLNV